MKEGGHWRYFTGLDGVLWQWSSTIEGIVHQVNGASIELIIVEEPMASTGMYVTVRCAYQRRLTVDTNDWNQDCSSGVQMQLRIIVDMLVFIAKNAAWGRKSNTRSSLSLVTFIAYGRYCGRGGYYRL